MEQRLLQDLHLKLGDLEHKVQAYRHDKTAEFQRYYGQVLHDVTPSVALSIEQSLASSLSDYPALAPGLQLGLGQHRQNVPRDHRLQVRTLTDADSQLASTRLPTGSDQPSPLGAEDGAYAAPGSGNPHEREKEFQGLFTPFFLPLLDSSPNLPASPPPATSSPLAQPVVAGTDIGRGLGVRVGTADQQQGPSQQLQGKDMEGPNETGARHGTSPSPSSSPSQAASPRPGRPGNGRCPTDDASSSALSDKSDTKIPRSALRRSSSSAKSTQPSPRRVRFEFKGAEVLPTASPQPSDFPTPRPASPILPDQPRSFDEIVVGDGGNEKEPVDSEPPPRKISSSEALRALSRAPLDEGTIWTVVNPGSEESAPASIDSSPTPPIMNPKTTATTAATPAKERWATLPSVAGPSSKYSGEDVGSEESSDEDFLAMAKPKSFKNKKSIHSDTAPRLPGAKAEPSSPRPSKAEEEEKDHTSSEDFEEEEDMFHFETGGLSAPPRVKRRPPPLQDKDSSTSRNLDPLEASQATSPAIPISRPSASSGPSTPTTTKFQVGSLGSYKGRPVIMPVVKNPAVHAQAASLGEFNTFVGGLDGRSGVDEGDLNSFRASLVQDGYSGTPRSLTERMMMEDAQVEAERNNGN